MRTPITDIRPPVARRTSAALPPPAPEPVMHVLTPAPPPAPTPAVRPLYLGALASTLALAIFFPLYPYIGVATYTLRNPLPRGYIPPVVDSLRLSVATPKPSAAPEAPKPVVTPAEQASARLKIPKIGVDTNLNEGLGDETMDIGPWRRPGTSTPELGGNTVIAAHRYRELRGANTFFYLDRLVVGDRFTLSWAGKDYEYEVRSTSVVARDALEIENPTETPRVTLYTCTPLWSSTQRLVVVGEPV